MSALLVNQAINDRPVTHTCASYVDEVGDLVARASATAVVIAVVLAFLSLS